MRFLTLILTAITSLCLANENRSTSDTHLSPYWFDNRITVFTPFHYQYEYVKPHAPYVGIDLWVGPSISSNHGEFYKYPGTYSSTRGAIIGKVEAAFGYNFLISDNKHLTPFLGFGVFKDFLEHRFDRDKTRYENILPILEDPDVSFTLPRVYYGTIGFKQVYDFCPTFLFGVKLQGLVGWTHEPEKWGNPIYGLECGLPITCRLGKTKHWELCLEPYNIFFLEKRFYNNFLGLHFTVGLRF